MLPSAPEHLRLTLTAMTASGECVANHDGLDVFVAFGLPGEVVDSQVVHRRKGFAKARITRVIEASPERIAPPCPHFGACGGCEWQHIAYEAQLRFKRDIVHDQLQHIGHIAEPNVRSCIPSPKCYGYRNRIQLVATPNGRLGYRAQATHATQTSQASPDVIEIKHCPIVDERLNAIIANASVHSGSGSDLRIGDDNDEGLPYLLDVSSEASAFDQPATLHMTVGTHRYRVSSHSFFQVNIAVAEQLVHEVLCAADVRPGQRVLDLYCGVGLFTVPLAEAGASVTGIDESLSSIVDARHNLREAGCADRARMLAADVVDGLNQQDVISGQWDILIANPPRTGIKHEALLKAVSLLPNTIVYVSCAPATLARDLKVLIASGWTLIYAQPLDMFPQTHHTEIVALLQRLA